jgi:hypothetical protein
MSTPKFYTKSGSLTRYSFICGYCENRENEEGDTITIYMEHRHMHVIFVPRNSERVWETFDTVTPAYKLFNKLCREHKLKKINA